MKFRLLLAVDNIAFQKYLKEYFADSDIDVKSIVRNKHTWQKLLQNSGDIIVVNYKFIPPPANESLSIMNNLPEAPSIIVISDKDSSEENTELIASGADVVIYSGLPYQSIASAIDSCIDSRQQFYIKGILKTHDLQKPKLNDFIMNDKNMYLFINEVKQIISGNTPILILGETGVGKEHLAKAIHYESQSPFSPFIPVHIAGLPEQLLESELFGHEQGAYTGAHRYRKGAFELAHTGTIFLDEIGEIPLHLQTKLLRVLQDYEIKPIGSERTIKVDVRVIAATNRNLQEEVNKGNFRLDLFYRLNVVPLTIPPLRERKKDIPTLALHLMEAISRKYSKPVNGFSKKAINALCNYDWPGNTRELINIIERAVILCKSDEITDVQVDKNYTNKLSNQSGIFDELDINISSWDNKTLHDIYDEIKEKIDRLYITRVLEKTNGRVGEAAEIAGIHPRGLYAKMKSLNLKKEDFK